MAVDADQSLNLARGHCPSCGPRRLADIKGAHRSVFDDGQVWWQTEYRIMVCRGCESAYFQTVEIFSEDVEWRFNENGDQEQYMPEKVNHFPSPLSRDKPSWWVNLIFVGGEFGKFEQLVSDLYGCLNANLSVPATIATRTIFDQASELIGISPNLSFEAKLNALVDMGKIGLDERDVLEVLVDAGSAAAHRGWRPNPSELDTLVTLLENFLHRTFVLGEAARNLKAAVPAKPKRPPKRNS